MVVRRPTYCLIASVLYAVVVGLMPTALAAPPQFLTTLDYPTTFLSPFPGFDRRFMVSISPGTYPPLTGSILPREFEYAYPKGDSTITYTKLVTNDIKLIPVTSGVEDFRERRIEMALREDALSISKRSLGKEQQNKAGGLLNITIPIRSRMFESIFGEGGAGLKVSGFRKITFSGRSSWTDKQQTGFGRQSKFPSLNMEQVYRFDITGTIGSKITVSVSQDSRNDMPLANRLILRYKGAEDDVLQTVEAGNTTLNLPSTRFLQYSTSVQGLFGLKASAQVADVSVTAIASQEKGSTETVEISAGESSAATRVVREVEYRKRTIYDLGRLPLYRARADTLPEPPKYDFAPGDTIVNAIAYVDDMPAQTSLRASRPVGICYVDPTDIAGGDPTGEYTVVGNFERLPDEDYYVQKKQLYIQFLQPVLGEDDVLGIYLEVYRAATGKIDTIGNIATTGISDTLRLKLIKPSNYFRPNHHVWEYEWKNVYWLGGNDIDLENLEVNIYRGIPLSSNQQVNPDDLDHQGGVKYLQILGLDMYNESNTRVPDGKIDKNVGFIDRSYGLLYFRDRHPFDTWLAYDVKGDSMVRVEDTAAVSRNPKFYTDSMVLLGEPVPELYTQTSTTVGLASKYYLAITTREKGSATINLNSSNIIEGSEVVTYNGQRLTKGTQYDINYDFGRLTLLDEAYTDINSNLSVMFETAPFFSLSKKTLLGTRLEYAPSSDFKVGTTILYKSDKSTNRRPKVGEETSNITVWDADFNYRFKANLLTTLTNALPFISSQAESYMALTGEVAQSRPNPNVDGIVYIDDFEGSENSFSLGVTRDKWRLSSKPVGVVDSLSARGRFCWYNPNEAYSYEEIWNRTEGGTNMAQVLIVEFRPDTVKRIPDVPGDSFVYRPIDPEKSWNGFMRNISPSVAITLEDAQLLEFRLRGDAGIMHIDLGRISEDIDGNGSLDTEDKNGNGVLDDEEDTGLDGVFDQGNPGEFGYGPNNLDPNSDDFNIDDKWRINGTERNSTQGAKSDPLISGAATEDPDFDGLDRANLYYSYRVDLSDSSQFYVPGTRNKDNWKTIRIPLRDPAALDTVVGNPSWNELRFARIWFDSASTEYLNRSVMVEIAAVDLVSTTWADSMYVADSLRSGAAAFDVAVIDNAVDTLYRPPPGVQGYYDPTRDLVEKEQSLLLTYKDLNARMLVNSPDSGLVLAADTGLAIRKMYRAGNYMGYGKLEAYVHGDPAAANDSVMFFFRVGTDKYAYYEFRTILQPGWATGNNVLIDFNEITGLKAKLLDTLTKGYTGQTLLDKSDHYLVRIKPGGQDPTLTRIQYFAMGVVNLDTAKTASGQVWVDELRLTDVRDDVGMAATVGVSGNMSDLINYSFGYSTQDAYYRGVSASTRGGATNNLGSGQVKTSYSFSGSVRVDKFFPRSLQLSLPVSVNWSENVQQPLLRSNSDITVPEELKKNEASLTISKGMTVSEKIQANYKNPLFSLILNRLNTRFSYNATGGYAPTQPMFYREQYTANANYTLTMRKPPSVRPLAWAKPLKIPFGLPETRVYLYPTKLDFAGTLTGSYSQSMNQTGSNPQSTKREFNGTMDMGFKIFENLSGSYSAQTTRDMKDPQTVNLTINPKKFRTGKELRYSQGFRAAYSPNLFKFLTHAVDYSANYSDDSRITTDSLTAHNVNLRTSTNFNFQFKHQALIGTNKPAKAATTRQGKKPKPRSTMGTMVGTPLRGIRYVTDAIKPVSVKLSTSESVMYPSLTKKATSAFRFGLTNDPGVEPVETAAGNLRQARSTTQGVSGRSGVSLFSGISVDVGYDRNVRKSYESKTTENVSETWPDLTFNLRSIKGLWFIGKMFNSLSPSSNYSRLTEYTKRSGVPYKSEQRQRSQFSPLISITWNISKSLRTSARFETGTSTSTRYNESSGSLSSMVRSTTKGYSCDGSYNFRSPSGIKLPIFGRIKFESTMSFSVNASYRVNRDESATPQSNYRLQLTSEKTNLTIQPSASYSFSQTVKGGLTARWQDNNDVSGRRKSHSRELSLWVEMRF